MEKQVMIQGEYPIGATITCKEEAGKLPAVVLIAGTGKLDRDGNGLGFHSNLYKDLAQAFAEVGFAAVRYDKRGTNTTGGSFDKAGLSDFVSDAIAVIQYIKALPYVDENRLLVCGHSEGAMIATLLSEKEETAGLILLGGAATSLKDALYFQNRLIAEDLPGMKGLGGAVMRKSFHLDKQLATIDDMFEKSKDPAKEKISVKGSSMSAKWLREHGAYTSEQYAALLKQYGKPVLAITGKADFQADYRNLDALQGADHIQCLAPEGLTHILRVSEGESSIVDVRKLYRNLLKKPIDENLLQSIRDWLGKEI